MPSIPRIIAIVLLVLAVLGGIGSFLYTSDDEALEKHGVEVKGYVQEKWIGDPKLRSTFRNSRYLIGYEYATAAGENLRSEFAVTTRSEHDGLKVGSTVVVRYLPAQPKVHELVEFRDDVSTFRSLWGRLIVCSLLFLLGAGMLWLTIRTDKGIGPEADAEGAPGRPEVRRTVRRGNEFGVRVR